MAIVAVIHEFPKTMPAIQLVDRRARAAEEAAINPRDAVRCPSCWERIVWQRPTTIADRTQGWVHARTGQEKCSPVCDACNLEPGTHAIGGYEFDGAGMRWTSRNFLCSGCHEIHRQPVREVA